MLSGPNPLLEFPFHGACQSGHNFGRDTGFVSSGFFHTSQNDYVRSRG